jgi:Glycosyl hydrolase catalytic core
MRILTSLLACSCLFGVAGCGGGGGTISPTNSLSLSFSPSSAIVFTEQIANPINVTIVRQGTTGDVTLGVKGLPTGAAAIIQSPGSSNTGTITFSAVIAPAGTYPLTITASDGTVTGSASLSLVIGAVIQVSDTKNGSFTEAMSTSFQPAEWDNQFFTLNPSATTTLGNLDPAHIRLQGASQGVPQTTASAWDFTILDDITQPVLSVGDHSPEFQIAKAPPFMYTGGDNTNSFLDLTFAQFSGYAQNLVEYYNIPGGFTAPDGNHASPSGNPITWWGIYNEPNINNNLTPQQYVTMYNEIVPKMQAIDPTIKFAALELADFSGQPQTWVPPFVNNTTGVTAHVDVMATHFYSTCDQTDSDANVFGTIPGFVSDVNFFYSQMSSNPALASVPVWVTENNVNADFSDANGNSNCHPGQKFVLDLRGSSAFFAAWRPYVFSQLGKAGVQALYQWDFDADKQFGEVDYSTDAYQLSYWVDYWLERTFPSTAGADWLSYTTTDTSDLEILPVVNSDGSVVVMVADYAVNSPDDNNGPGAPRSFLIDTTAFGNFSSASLLTIDATTNVATGPTPSSVTPASKIPVTLNGYGVAFLTLK